MTQQKYFARVMDTKAREARMLRGIFYPGLLAGLIAGLFIFGAQQLKLVPLVIEAEKYENAGAPAAAPADRGP